MMYNVSVRDKRKAVKMSRKECLYCVNSWICKNPKKEQYKKEAYEAIDKGIDYVVPCIDWEDDSLPIDED